MDDRFTVLNDELEDRNIDFGKLCVEEHHRMLHVQAGIHLHVLQGHHDRLAVRLRGGVVYVLRLAQRRLILRFKLIGHPIYLKLDNGTPMIDQGL